MNYMITKKKFCTLLLLIFISATQLTFAQTFTGSGGSIITLTDTSRFNINVSGLSPSAIDFNYGLESVTINITHTQDRDIDCFLAAPDGTLIELTTDNGGTGDNYTNTVFRNDASTSITSGTAPFTGNFRPEGSLWRVNNGQNGNGTWQLRVIDDANNLITGSVTSWSLKFSNTPAQTFIFSQSNLPIVVINTNGQNIVDDPKIIADMSIIDNGTGVRNHLTDAANAYNGKIAIEIRGSSSQMFPKKSWGFETRDASGNNKLDVSIFGMPAEHDWILSANYTDKSFCRNVLSYQLSNEMGHYAVRTKYVDVVLNGTYQGIYVFMESIKRDAGRVDIANLHPYETTQPDVSGGYILKIDKTTGSGGGGWTSPYAPINHSNGQTIYIQYDFPQPDSIVPAQEAYIQAYVDSFEDALAGPNFRDTSVGYPKFISENSWIDYFFVNELSKNVDGYRISSYIHKDKSKKLKAGPVWDYDIAYGNANYCNGTDTTGWAYLFSCTGDSWQVPFWWQKLLSDTNYTNRMKCRWNNFRQTTLSNSHLNAVIDSITSTINESQAWNFNTWPILGTYVWPNPSPYPTTYAGEIQNLKNWMTTRLQWLDANIPGHCSCSVTFAQQPVSCAGQCDGQLVALGHSSYAKTYLWDNGNTDDSLFTLCPGPYSVSLTDDIGCTASASVTIAAPSVLTANINGTNAPCNSSGCQGSATVNVNGGTAPYTYSWSSGHTTASATGLCSGTYTVTVTDAHNCTTVSSVTISNPSSPALSVSTANNASCFNLANGSASVSVAGGTAPYTYQWSPSGGSNSSASGLSAGNYVVTVTDATNCPATTSVTITQPSALNVTLQSTNTPCFGVAGGSVTSSVSGGTAAYTYLWSPGGATSASLTNVAAGIYNVTVTDAAGCTQTSSATVSDAPVITASTNASPVSCHNGNDGSVSVTASGGTGTLNYLWSPGGSTSSNVNSLSSGNYSVIITDGNGCTTTRSAVIANPSALTVTLSSNPSSCSMANGTATVSASGGTSPYTYLWQHNNSASSTEQNLLSGKYFVTVTDANGCSVYDSVIVQNNSGMTANIITQQDVSCHGGSNGSASLSAVGGVAPYTYQWSPSGGNSSSAGGLSAGNYSVLVQDATGCTSVQQVVIGEPETISVSIAVQDALCYSQSSGRLTAHTIGGTSPFTFQWSPSGGTDSIANNLHAGNYSVTIADAHGCTATAGASVNQPSMITISSQIVNSTCNSANGSAVVTAGGGTPAYSYSWNPSVSVSDSATNLAFGNYSVTVTDQHGCSLSSVVSVLTTSPPQLSVSSMTQATCNGDHDGALSLNVTSGSGPFIYDWSPAVSSTASASGLPAGLYSIIVTDIYGCRDSIGTFVEEPAPLGALIFAHNPSCANTNDGMLIAEAGGGTMPYSYLWTPGNQTTDTAFGLTTGTYALQLTDAHGCTATTSGAVTAPPAISLSGTTAGHTCFNECNGEASVIASGGTAPYSYLWNNGTTSETITNACAGTARVIVSDAMGCPDSISFVITEDDSLSISITHVNASCTTCADGSALANVSGGTPPYNYNWTPGNDTTVSVNSLLAGVYTLCITDAHQCMKCDTVAILDLSIGIEELTKSTTLYVFPNPANDYTVFAFTLKSQQQVNLSVFTADGSLVATILNSEQSAGEHLIRYETLDLAKGVYYYKFLSNGAVKTGALVVVK